MCLGCPLPRRSLTLQGKFRCPQNCLSTKFWLTPSKGAHYVGKLSKNSNDTLKTDSWGEGNKLGLYGISKINTLFLQKWDFYELNLFTKQTASLQGKCPLSLMSLAAQNRESHDSQSCGHGIAKKFRSEKQKISRIAVT